MDILKFITAGNVDDGKSTLIGRLLYDTDSILEDQLEAIKNANRKNDDGSIDLAILTDGLKAEREQGITIDVAYKYFQTSKRKFIIADAPGHVQYTRNMITGASGSQLAIILIDARKGVTEQTIRHAFLVGLLNLKYVVVCINKMDMVDYDPEVFNKIKTDFTSISSRVQLSNVQFIPVSALKGDNVVGYSSRMLWYSGPALMEYLETVSVEPFEPEHSRFYVQYVIRPQTDALHDYRGYAGQVSGGQFKVGDEVCVFPSKLKTNITHIELNEQQLTTAENGASVILRFSDELDISRGDLIAPAEDLPQLSKDLDVSLCWLGQQALDRSKVYLLQTQCRISQVKVKNIKYKVDVNTLEELSGDSFELNDIGKVQIRTATEWMYDPYSENRHTGGGILIDPSNNLTVGAVLIGA